MMSRTRLTNIIGAGEAFKNGKFINGIKPWYNPIKSSYKKDERIEQM